MTKTLLPTALAALPRLAAVILLSLLASAATPALSEREAPAKAAVWRRAYKQALQDRDALAQQGTSGRQLENEDALIDLLRAKLKATRKEPGDMVTMKKRQSVVYVHHTRDRDGDVVLLFREMRACGDDAPMRSSPLVSIRRISSAVIDRHGSGGLGKYLITTLHSEYEVQISRDLALHIARELGASLP